MILFLEELDWRIYYTILAIITFCFKKNLSYIPKAATDNLKTLHCFNYNFTLLFSRKEEEWGLSIPDQEDERFGWSLLDTLNEGVENGQFILPEIQDPDNPTQDRDRPIYSEERALAHNLSEAEIARHNWSQSLINSTVFAHANFRLPPTALSTEQARIWRGLRSGGEPSAETEEWLSWYTNQLAANNWKIGDKLSTEAENSSVEDSEKSELVEDSERWKKENLTEVNNNERAEELDHQLNEARTRYIAWRTAHTRNTYFTHGFTLAELSRRWWNNEGCFPFYNMIADSTESANIRGYIQVVAARYCEKKENALKRVLQFNYKDPTFVFGGLLLTYCLLRSGKFTSRIWVFPGSQKGGKSF